MLAKAKARVAREGLPAAIGGVSIGMADQRAPPDERRGLIEPPTAPPKVLQQEVILNMRPDLLQLSL